MHPAAALIEPRQSRAHPAREGQRQQRPQRLHEARRRTGAEGFPSPLPGLRQRQAHRRAFRDILQADAQRKGQRPARRPPARPAGPAPPQVPPPCPRADCGGSRPAPHGPSGHALLTRCASAARQPLPAAAGPQHPARAPPPGPARPAAIPASARSMAGSSRLHTLAASMMPAAMPQSIRRVRGSSARRTRKTPAAPSAVQSAGSSRMTAANR